ncbi:YagK/YfjJ domain-containing protein [Serratia fonticola]|uniref:YagK/YfjJ domain-containing protein n=1 Tax=Serratia fonticola TaxID=47917 RepID=UPI0021BA86E5|nr:inovirus-type Gp2 protein [Serratia fonticola]
MDNQYQKRTKNDEYDTHLQLATSLLQTQESGSETLSPTNDFDTLGNIYERLRGLQSLVQDTSVATFPSRGSLDCPDTLKYRLRLTTPGQAALLAENLPPYRIFHPTLDCFIQLAKRYHDSYQQNNGGCAIYRQDIPEQANWLQRLFHDFREDVETVSHPYLVQQFLMKNEPYRQKARHVVNELLRQYKSLMMVGIDLSYTPITKDDISPEQVRQHRRQLLAMLHSHPHFRHCLGYAWKLEHGPIKGFSYQLVCFFNGSQVEPHDCIGMDIGTCWQTITQKTGRAFCRKNLQEDYVYPGLLMFYQSDTAAPEKLYRIFDNMTRTDTYARLALPNQLRTFSSAMVMRSSVTQRRPSVIPKKSSSPTPSKTESIPQPSPKVDIMLGMNQMPSAQFGILGEANGKTIGVDLNHPQTICAFGLQGSGKSYTLGSLIEMTLSSIDNINTLPAPRAGVIFHYSTTQDYAPEFTSMGQANSVAEDIARLREQYKAAPQALKDVLILTPASKVAQRQAEHPDISVLPIAFSAAELNASHWKFLMGTVGNPSLYVRQINGLMRTLRGELTLETLREAVSKSELGAQKKKMALQRLDFASEYIDGMQRLQTLLRPGRLIIVDLRDEYIEKVEALGLFVVMLQIFAEATWQGETFSKLVVFDEAHKYIGNDGLVAGLIEIVREMRHKATSILVASQDPPSVPVALIELSTQLYLHRFNSPAWLRHIQKANTALRHLEPEVLSRLTPGEAFVWASKATDAAFTHGIIKVNCRPRVTLHGGHTRTATGN